MHRGDETEVKIRVPDVAPVIQLLQKTGFAVSAPRVFEANTIYDKSGQELRRANMLLRLRQAGDQHVITWKGPEKPGRHKQRPEIETTVSSGAALAQILEQLGYAPDFRYEKYRTEFKNSREEGVVTIDETPIGNFLELEGTADWIDQTAKELGFTESQYVLESYGKLYTAECERQGVQPTNMVFAS